MPLLSRITTRRWPSIKGVCSSWDGPSPITPMTARKPNRRSRRSHLLSARPRRRRLPAGYFGPATLAACAKRDIEPYIATGRDPHHPSWQQRFAPLSDPPPVDASSQVKMAYKLKLVEHVLPQEHQDERLREIVYQRYRDIKIEAPAPNRLLRQIRSARHTFE